MPQETKSNPAERPTLQGLVASREDEAALLAALEQAFDYRGDITLHLNDNRAITGYIFDRHTGRTLADSYLRLMTADSDDKISVHYHTIARIEFTGRDTAAGKSFDSWLKKYVEKKLAGEKASIDSEPLE
ncbi:MAG: hypothetical protein JNK58_14020 [Phycisphaerae bacterium]|nr:hypothetical protein [Phycisphaerae bacterium]